jgi:hypothetical protein
MNNKSYRQFTLSQSFYLSTHINYNIIFIYTLYILKWLPPCSTSQMCPFWPCPQVRLSPLLIRSYLYLPCLFWLTRQLVIFPDV